MGFVGGGDGRVGMRFLLHFLGKEMRLSVGVWLLLCRTEVVSLTFETPDLLQASLNI